MDRTRSRPLEEFEKHALLPGSDSHPRWNDAPSSPPSVSRFRPVHHVVVVIAALNDVRSDFRDFESLNRRDSCENLFFSATRVYLSCVFPRETDRFSVPSFERRRGMKPSSQPTTLVDVFPCTRGCVPDSLFFLSPSLYLASSFSLSLCFFFSRAKEWTRIGGVQISWAARERSVSERRHVCEKPCDSLLSVVTTVSRRGKESKGKKRGGRPTRREACARIVPWTFVETNVRGSLLKRSKTRQDLPSGPLSRRTPSDFIFATVTTGTRGSS